MNIEKKIKINAANKGVFTHHRSNRIQSLFFNPCGTYGHLVDYFIKMHLELEQTYPRLHLGLQAWTNSSKNFNQSIILTRKYLTTYKIGGSLERHRYCVISTLRWAMKWPCWLQRPSTQKQTTVNVRKIICYITINKKFTR